MCFTLLLGPDGNNVINMMVELETLVYQNTKIFDNVKLTQGTDIYIIKSECLSRVSSILTRDKNYNF